MLETGVDDWLAYYDHTLSVDEHREVAERAMRDEGGDRLTTISTATSSWLQRKALATSSASRLKTTERTAKTTFHYTGVW
ncbi:hypothetical protein C491_02850 [Natronococcus amylolyticus DSM 10524]|uniref:Uncharacterized protein n=1 Tax=Natronococcus amylolyticus DSM 10524 TaxID=1227497 RepID=L9XF12_9EURY|nr:hypothetical protein [Natronococcus amylolyticus]ELY60202.1 hypothetical protein C491_02850 [Natronococcus amylolyticus DSM 10524]